MTDNTHDAEEVVQEAFLRGYQKLSQFAANSNFDTWVYRIAANYAIDRIRQRHLEEARHARPNRAGDDGAVLEALASVRDPCASPERLARSAELAARMQQALDALTPAERTAIVMRHWEGCAIEEIAAVQGSLQQTVEHISAEPQQPLWMAYDLPAVSAHDTNCCENFCNGICGTCALEGRRGETQVLRDARATVTLERSATLLVLLRVEHHQVLRIRLASANCTLDAGGLRVVWLTGVQPAESVALLAHFVHGKNHQVDDENDLSSQAIMAIAQHADASADGVLASLVSPDQPAGLRGETAFWLGVSRGKPGLALLENMVRDDPDSNVRAKVVLAMSVRREPAAIDDMIQLAKKDASTEVREQALFWLAQKAGKKVANTMGNAIENDPDTEVKKKAVFALAQMPKDEGVPKLIELAQNSRNPALRKQAMFWLGQCRDPRALAFFEKILAQ